MENRITTLFNNKKHGILSIFFTAGFPKSEDTISIATYLEQAGVDLIEIGIPFSDPVADGPVIQESNKIALENGMTLKKLLVQVREIRKTIKLPVILMGYINPVIQYGFEKFCRDAAAAGVDGLIIPDLPLDEYQSEYRKSVETHGLKMTFLISPSTSEERIRKIDEVSSGFIYAVSASSITGSRDGFSAEQLIYFEKLKELHLKNPFLIGFGIFNRDTFKEASRYGAGAIIGSAFISLLNESPTLQNDIHGFVRKVRGLA